MKIVLIRVSIYVLLAGFMAQLMYWEALTATKDVLYRETGHTEIMESGLLGLMVIVLAIKARNDDSWRNLAVCMLLTFAWMLIRENDHGLDRLLFHGSWKWVGLVPLLGGAAYFWRYRKEVGEQLLAYSSTTSFGLCIAGFMVLGFSRLFGRKDFWIAVMGDERFMRVTKNAGEEGTELIALTVLLAAAIEFAFFTRSRRASRS